VKQKPFPFYIEPAEGIDPLKYRSTPIDWKLCECFYGHSLLIPKGLHQDLRNVYPDWYTHVILRYDCPNTGIGEVVAEDPALGYKVLRKGQR
jgi:hypothetical protein